MASLLAACLFRPLEAYWAVMTTMVAWTIFNVTNHFNPRDFQGNQPSAEYGRFYNGVGRKYGLKFVIERK